MRDEELATVMTIAVNSHHAGVDTTDSFNPEIWCIGGTAAIADVTGQAKQSAGARRHNHGINRRER